MFEVLGRMSSAGMGAERRGGSSGIRQDDEEIRAVVEEGARTVPNAPQNRNRRAPMYAARADRRTAFATLGRTRVDVTRVHDMN